VAGDAAFTNGISFEALNNIAEQTNRLIVVLNDNEWSIDRNVGAISAYFHGPPHYREAGRQDRGHCGAPRRRGGQEHALALHPL
jgi:deoxyxylulose-5-phosphate synthase